MSGDPVRISQLAGNGSAASTSTQALGLYCPGTSTLRTLQPYEQVVLTSLLLAFQTGFGGTMYITTLPGGTPSTSVSTANILLISQFQTDESHTWRDDGTGAMTGLPGVVPSVFNYISNGSASTFVSGSGLIVNTAPAGQAAQRNPQFARLSPNANATM
ncbi:MAG: hypothetical protein ABSB42_07940 [Tepidisphaeraceae bacterium]|jgi:hypothetical protein